VNFESFLFSYFEIPESSIFFLSFWKFQMGGNNVGVLFKKFGGFKICFDKVQVSSTLFLGILGVFPKTFSEVKLLVPFVPTHGNILS